MASLENVSLELVREESQRNNNLRKEGGKAQYRTLVVLTFEWICWDPVRRWEGILMLGAGWKRGGLSQHGGEGKV